MNGYDDQFSYLYTKAHEQQQQKYLKCIASVMAIYYLFIGYPIAWHFRYVLYLYPKIKQ